MNSVVRLALWAAALILMSRGAMAGEDPKVAAEVIALARAQWTAEAQGKGMAEQMASTADDYTEFNADFPGANRRQGGQCSCL